MKRSIHLLACLLSILPLLSSAQSSLDYTTIDRARQLSFARQETVGAQTLAASKWQLHTFGGISGSYGFLNRYHASSLSTPVTLQVSRPLNRNLYSFAAITAAPVAMHFNSVFLQPRQSKYSSPSMMTGVHQFGWYTRAEAGLFYINDEKTFSISGSFYMERASYPVFMPYAPQRTPSTISQ